MPDRETGTVENILDPEDRNESVGESVGPRGRQGEVESRAGLQLRVKRRRDRLVGCKVTQDEFNLIRQTASDRGMTVSDTLRQALNTVIFG